MATKSNVTILKYTFCDNVGGMTIGTQYEDNELLINYQ